MNLRAYRLTSAGALLALILLCLTWELWLAPLRPGGSWLALKVLPLLAALPGVLKGRAYTLQWASAVALVYGAEGLVRWWSDAGIVPRLAFAEFVLAALFTVSAALYARSTHKTNNNQ